MGSVICPNCGSPRIHRVTQRVKRMRASHQSEDSVYIMDDGRYTDAGYYACLDCWHKWDGTCKDAGGVLPPGVEARRYG